MLTVSSFLRGDWNPYTQMQSINIQKSELAIQVKIGERFEIISITPIPPGMPSNFQWQDKDDWKIVSCPPSVKFLKSNETAPDGCGGELFQTILMRAKQAGSGQIVLQRDNKQVAIDVAVLPTAQKMEWKKPKQFPFGTQEIDLLYGDDYYLIKNGESVRIISWLKAPYPTYVWQKDDAWHLKLDDPKAGGITILESSQELSEYVNMLCQDWKLQFPDAGIVTLLFTRGTEQMKIIIKVESTSLVNSLVSSIFG